jgi:ankyrin repeat protein
MIKSLYALILITFCNLAYAADQYSLYASGDIKQIEDLLKNGTFDGNGSHCHLQRALSEEKIDEETGIKILRLLNEYNQINLNKLIYYSGYDKNFSLKILRTAHELGGDVSYVDNHDGQNSLMLTIFYNNVSVAKCLIELGANVNYRSKEGHLVCMAAHYRTYEILWLLLANGANIRVIEVGGIVFLNHLKNDPKLLNLVKEFIVYAVKLDDLSKFKGAQNALLLAAYMHGAPLHFNTTTVIQFLMSKGARFTSAEYESHFNKLIADKPEVLEAIKEYKNLLAQNVDKTFGLIPDLANIVAQY